jgi:hypothetical protein
MAQRHSEYRRQPDDQYFTPPWVTRCVTPWLAKRATHVWEPAAGNKHVVRALRQEGFNVCLTSNDFLEHTQLPNDRVTAICTNPPYGGGGHLAEKFIAHALDFHHIKTVCMLLRIDFDSGKTRRHLFALNRAWAHKIVLLDRIMWFPGDVGPSTNHAWFLWDKSHKGLPTISYAGKQ